MRETHQRTRKALGHRKKTKTKTKVTLREDEVSVKI